MLSKLFFFSLLLFGSPAWAVCNQYSTTYEAKATAIPDVPRNTILRSPDYCTKFVRITDSTDGESAMIADIQFSGISSDNTRLSFAISGGTHYGWSIYTFDPVTMQSSFLYTIDSSTGCAQPQYLSWDMTGLKPKTFYCHASLTTTSTREIKEVDMTTGTPVVTNLVSAAAVLAKTDITGTVASSVNSTCITGTFTDFENAVDNTYVGLELIVGANAAQTITSYTGSSKQLCVGSALSGVSIGQAITIRATGSNGNRMFGVSPNGAILCTGVSDGAHNATASDIRGTSAGRYLLAYRFSDGALKLHRLSYEEIIGASGRSYTPKTLGGIHAGAPSKDGRYCEFTVEGQGAINGAYWLWAPFETNPIATTGDGKIYGPSTPDTVGHPGVGSDRVYSVGTTTFQYVPFASMTTTTNFYTWPVKSGKTWYVGQDQYNTAQQREDNIVSMVNEYGTNAACGVWELVSGSIYRTTVDWPSGFGNPCDQMVALTPENNPRVYQFTQPLTQVGTATSTAATCPGLMSAGTFCWASDINRPYVWAFNSLDLTNRTATFHTISSGSNTTACFSSGSAVDNAYVGRHLEIPLTGGSGISTGAMRLVTAYVGATKCATFAALQGSGTPLVGGSAVLHANAIYAFDQRPFLQCIVEVRHGTIVDTGTSKVIDCPPNVPQNEGGSDAGSSFYQQMITTVSNDGCWYLSRIPWSPSRYDVFMHSACETRPALTNIKAVNNTPAANNFKPVTIAGDQFY